MERQCPASFNRFSTVRPFLAFSIDLFLVRPFLAFLIDLFLVRPLLAFSIDLFHRKAVLQQIINYFFLHLGILGQSQDHVTAGYAADVLCLCP